LAILPSNSSRRSHGGLDSRPRHGERALPRLRLIERRQLGGERGEGLIGRRHRLIFLL